ncbi:MAG: hypothetical protein MHM6MM_005803 [Cercozoa sp. M6MM]
MSSVDDTVAGAVAGLLSKTIEYPFDTLKVRQQTDAQKSALRSLRDLVTTEGPSALFRGLPAPLLGGIVENSLVFATYGSVRKAMESRGSERSQRVCQRDSGSQGVTGYQHWCNVAVAGAASGVSTTLWLCPVESVKVRLQAAATTRHYQSAWHCAAHMARTEGTRAFTRGIGATFLRECPGGAAYFLAYESACYLQQVHADEELGMLPLMLAGSMAGCAYWLLTFPADTIKSVQQGSLQQHSFLSAAHQLYRTGGVRSFYRGLGVTLVRALPSNGVILASYEMTMRFLQQQRSR